MAGQRPDFRLQGCRDVDGQLVATQRVPDLVAQDQLRRPGLAAGLLEPGARAGLHGFEDEFACHPVSQGGLVALVDEEDVGPEPAHDADDVDLHLPGESRQPVGVTEELHVRRAEGFCRFDGLFFPHGPHLPGGNPVAAGLAGGEHHVGDLVSPSSQERLGPPAADLDVVGMRPERQHPLSFLIHFSLPLFPVLSNRARGSNPPPPEERMRRVRTVVEAGPAVCRKDN